MNSNYEAQRQFAIQRLADRREQGRVERLLREGNPGPRHTVGHFLLQLFRRSGQRREKKSAEVPQSAELAVVGKGRG